MYHGDFMSGDTSHVFVKSFKIKRVIAQPNSLETLCYVKPAEILDIYTYQWF